MIMKKQFLVFIVIGFVLQNLIGAVNWGTLLGDSKLKQFWHESERARRDVIDFYEDNRDDLPPEFYQIVAQAYFLDSDPAGTSRMNAIKIIKLYKKAYYSGQRGPIFFLTTSGFLSFVRLSYFKDAFIVSFKVYDNNLGLNIALKMAYAAAYKGKLFENADSRFSILSHKDPAAAFAREDKDMNLFYLNVVNESSDPELPRVLLLALGLGVDNDDVSLNAAKYLLIKKYLGEVPAKEFYAAVEDKFKADSARLEAFKAACAEEEVKLDFDAAFERLKTLLITLMKMGVM